MANTVDNVRIHNELVALLLAGPYYAVDYTPATKLAGDIDTAVATAITPASVQTNEISAVFEPDQQHGRAHVLDRGQWLWLGIVKFDREVTAHQAEELWQSAPKVLPRSSVFRQATIELRSAEYEHPIRQQGHNGSRIEFTFSVRLSRR